MSNDSTSPLTPGEIVYPANAPAVQELSSSNERLQLLYELGIALCGRLDSSSLLAEVPRAVNRLVGAQRCFVATFEGSGALTPRVCHGVELPADPAEWPVSQSIVRRVIDQGVAILSPDAQQDRQLSKQASILRHQIRSVMCVPLGRPKESCLGILYADNRAEPGTFTKEDLKFATALSHYVYLGLRNAAEIEKARAARELSEERAAVLQSELQTNHKIIGSSPLLLKAYDTLKRAAEKDVPVLLQGESGTGKELFARAVHVLSPRKLKPFLAVSVAEINPNLIESELFGHEKGAFTGAFQKKIGRFELADGGTLFLDEVAEIPPHVQAKLLRVLETRSFERVGGYENITSDFRLVCATHQDLEQMVRDKKFREDLFYRLVGVRIPLPTLRERPEDIPELARHVLQRLKSRKVFTEKAIRQLQRYPWPGNVRQFVRVVEAVDALCDGNEVTPADLPPPLGPGGPTAEPEEGKAFPTLDEVLARAEREHVGRALAQSGGNKERAREMLDVSKDTFWNRLKKYGMM